MRQEMPLERAAAATWLKSAIAHSGGRTQILISVKSCNMCVIELDNQITNAMVDWCIHYMLRLLGTNLPCLPEKVLKKLVLQCNVRL
jgi:hypothetical protein